MAPTHKRLSEAVEDYLRYRQARYAKCGVAQDGYVLRRFVAQVGDVQLRHLRAERVADWFYGPGGLMTDHVTRDGVHRVAIKASTHNYYRVRLASLFRLPAAGVAQGRPPRGGGSVEGHAPAAAAATAGDPSADARRSRQPA